MEWCARCHARAELSEGEVRGLLDLVDQVGAEHPPTRHPKWRPPAELVRPPAPRRRSHTAGSALTFRLPGRIIATIVVGLVALALVAGFGLVLGGFANATMVPYYAIAFRDIWRPVRLDERNRPVSG